jgi:multimeric flavodoxin WrbA
MKIIVLNGSPRPNGNTTALVKAFKEGAETTGNKVEVFNIAQMHIAGCKACEYCHTKGNGHCIQSDDMQKVYPVLDMAEMIVLASPIYYHGYSGQLQCAINRIYALDRPKHLKKAALFLSSGASGVYDGAIFAYKNSFIDYLGLQDMGIITAYGFENKSSQKLAAAKALGEKLC